MENYFKLRKKWGGENRDTIYISYFLEFGFWFPVRYHFMAILVPFVIPGGRKRGKNGGYYTHSLIFPRR